MERLDQGHLHHKLEVPGLTCPGWKSNLGQWAYVVGGEHSRKEPFEQLIKLIFGTSTIQVSYFSSALPHSTIFQFPS
jgi:hypothetical protein